MAAEWLKVRIEDVADVKGGKRLPKGTSFSVTKTNYPYIRLVDVNDRKITDNDIQYLRKDTHEAISRYIVNGKDVCLAIVGHTIGVVFYVDEKWDGANLTENAARITNYDGLDSKYLFYFLTSPEGYNEIMARAVGSAQKKLPLYNIKSIEIPLPPLPEQKAIAHILGTLDDKIELNRRMNRTLEAMARAVFKSWFVDFDPVRDKMEGREPEGMDAQTAAFFPDRLVDSELGEVPEGWEWGTVGDIARNIRNGIAPSDVDPETTYIGLEHMPRGSICLDTWETAEKVTSTKSQFQKGDVLFGKLRPYFKKVGVSFNDGVCSSDILVIKPRKKQWESFLLIQLSRQEFIDYTESVSTGTRMPRVNWKAIAEYPIPIPSREILEHFNGLVKPSIAKMEINTFESRTLAALRNVLLPKLQSGEIEMGGAPHA